MGLSGLQLIWFIHFFKEINVHVQDLLQLIVEIILGKDVIIHLIVPDRVHVEKNFRLSK